MATLTQLDALTQKYRTVLELMPELQVQVTRLELRDGKLLIQAEAPSQEMKRRVWDQIITVDPTYPDLICQITVNSSMPRTVSPALIGADAQARNQTYVVQEGDTLAKISHAFYGDSRQAARILQVNRGQIDDPERLQQGIVLLIPS